ncbi:hypothetical protein GWK47_009879 [Chionoecetes opilio]|uniref:Uncharacterized protein n=1 Tax=Chionoecetes opilio TaxID=41210 RepID=A0A8J5C3M2_CHIOP|nr:hypothetical protein GWK47_009879 [Chionoecetes opilio]
METRSKKDDMLAELLEAMRVQREELKEQFQKQEEKQERTQQELKEQLQKQEEKQERTQQEQWMKLQERQEQQQQQLEKRIAGLQEQLQCVHQESMNTKTKTLLWLFDKCPPIFSVPGNHGFTGPYPPTGEQVLLQYHGYHKQLQQASHLQSSALDAARLVTKDLQDWWVNTGITLKSWQAIEQMILTDIEEYKLRKSKRNRTTDTETKKREEFLANTRQTFWIVQPEFEKRLAAKQQLEKQDQTDKEDWLYLEGVRGVTRTATLGPRDQKLAKRQKRKFLDQQAAQERKAKDCLRSATAAHSADAVEESHDPESEDSTEIPMHTVSVSLPKVSKKMESVPMEACFIADKYAISNRAVTELAAAFRKDGGKNLEEYNLSVNTTGRRRQSARLEKAADITKWQLGDITSKMYALHWDGKLIKSLMHVGKDMERVAVILTGTDGQEVLLSIVGMEGRSTAENEAAKIIQVLNDHPLDTSRIGALVFDTTAVNSGVWSGVVVRLETEFGRSLLQLACRHHIHELIGGASCSIVYGPTTGPNEQLFKRLVNNWSELNHNNYTLVEVTAPQRELTGYIHNTITFLQTWIENSTKETLRHDYLELAELTLLFLGGTVPAGRRSITIKAPGAFHHARWISKTLYTFKVALFRCQLGDVYAPEELEDITSLAVFLAIFYTKAWLTCTSAADAPSNDLALMKNLLKAEASISKDPMKWPAKFLSFVVPARQKLQNHLCFVKLPVAQWTTSDNYRHGKKVVANLPVVNDAAERALGLATDLNTNRPPNLKSSSRHYTEL